MCHGPSCSMIAVNSLRMPHSTAASSRPFRANTRRPLPIDGCRYCNVEDRGDGGDRASRQGGGFFAANVELFPPYVGGAALFHLAHDEADVEQGALEAASDGDQDQAHHAAD